MYIEFIKHLMCLILLLIDNHSMRICIARGNTAGAAGMIKAIPLL